MLNSFRKLLPILKGSKYARFQSLSVSEHVPPVSILVPSYNEELTIIENVRSLLSLEYPEYEVVVVNDGSKDRTLQVLMEAFQLKKLSKEKLEQSAAARSGIANSRGLS